MQFSTIISLDSKTAGTVLKRWPKSAQFPAPEILEKPESLPATSDPASLAFICCHSADNETVTCCRETRRSAPGIGLVVLMSTPPDSESVTRMLDAGADDCLLVPATAEEFRARLEAWNRRTGQSLPADNRGGASWSLTGDAPEDSFPLPDSVHDHFLSDLEAERLLAYNVTERHQMEANLRESEEALRKHERELSEAHELLSFHINNSPLAVVEWDSRFRVSYWSPRAEQLFGWPSGEVLGLHPDDWPFVHPDDAERVSGYMTKLLSGSASDKLCLNRNFTRDGRTIHCEWYNSVRFDENGRMSSIFSIIDDVTDRIEAEKELAELNQELEQRVAERTARLQAVNQELESFCYSVSHDLRAPLRGINGFTQALQEVPSIQIDDTARGYLGRVRAAADRMGQLIDDLLQLSRISRHELRRGRVNLSDLAAEIIRDMRQSDPRREVEVELEANIQVYADARLTRIMLENLLSNAWKFTSKTNAPRISFDRLRDGNGKTVCRVCDNGVGFDMRYAHKLFGPFQRLHSMSEFPGTGIGLATVKRIVQLHGGQVRAEASPGEGAAFSFTLGYS